MVFFLTLGFSLCSLAYELLFIRITSLVYGAQIKQYNLLIALFTFSLGLGSLLFEKISKKYSNTKILIAIEISLFFLGLLGPFLIVGSYGWLEQSGVFVAYAISVLVGILSGLELPLMMSWKSEAQGKILTWDYLGMVLATFLIPLLFFRHFGLGATAVAIATTNLFLLFLVLGKSTIRPALLALYGVSVSLIWWSGTFVNNFLSRLYLL